MEITVFGGTGNLGSYFSANLAGKSKLKIIGRKNSNNLNHIKKHGIELKFPDKILNIPQEQFNYIGEFHSSAISNKQDLVIVSLKQPDFNMDVAQQIYNITDNNSAIGIISNGLAFNFLYDLKHNQPDPHIESVDPKGEILKILKNRQLFTIIPLMGGNTQSPGIINIINSSNNIRCFIGGNKIDQNMLLKINTIFNEANIHSEMESEINKRILEKLQFALSINTISALLNKHIETVFYDELNRKYILYVTKFIKLLAEALSIKNMRSYKEFIANDLQEPRYSSFHDDIANHKTPEINVIVSAPIELAKRLTLAISIKPLEMLEEMLTQKSHNITITDQEISNFYRSIEKII